ncbi:MAG: DNA polymerase IV [candidate division KSB1 bacterium]|nr:DNA polymerase IV [candidate division KSB1 bacterium]
MGRVVLHLDMDAFFAAIEQRDHPELQGKPVVVGADPKGGKGRGVVSTCSYEARAFGIRSAMPISQAYRLCPWAVFLPVRGERYLEVSAEVMRILGQFSPQIEQVSIDEAFVDLTGTERLLGPPREVGVRIKQEVHRRTRLTASVGIAPNKFIAKVASDLRKPDGLVVVEESEVTDFLWPLPVSKLWGVGEKTMPQLQLLGLHTIGDVAKQTPQFLQARFGALGLHLWRLAQGIDERPVVPVTEAKSLSKETTFPEDTDDHEVLHGTLVALADAVARGLRQEKVRGYTVTLKIRLEDFATFTRSRTLSQATDSSQTILTVGEELLRCFDRGHKRVRLLGIGVSGLVRDVEGQLALFDEPARSPIDEVMDRVRERFGEKAISRASAVLDRKRKEANGKELQK